MTSMIMGYTLVAGVSNKGDAWFYAKYLCNKVNDAGYCKISQNQPDLTV